MREAALQLGRDAFEVVRQKLAVEIVRRRLRGPGDARLLIGAEQHALAFLAQIDFAREIGGVDDLAVQALQLRNGLRDDVVVLHGEHRQRQADELADLARPQAAGVDHVLGVDRALVGDDVPRNGRAADSRRRPW